MYEDVFYLVRLLDLDAHTDAVHAGLQEDPLVLVARHGEGIEQDFWR